MGRGGREVASVALYAVAIACAFVAPMASCLLYFVVAMMWFVPDRRLEHALER